MKEELRTEAGQRGKRDFCEGYDADTRQPCMLERGHVGPCDSLGFPATASPVQPVGDQGQQTADERTLADWLDPDGGDYGEIHCRCQWADDSGDPQADWPWEIVPECPVHWPPREPRFAVLERLLDAA